MQPAAPDAPVGAHVDDDALVLGGGAPQRVPDQRAAVGPHVVDVRAHLGVFGLGAKGRGDQEREGGKGEREPGFHGYHGP